MHSSNYYRPGTVFISQPLRHYHYVQINILNNSSRLAVNFKMYQRFHKIQIIQLAEVAWPRLWVAFVTVCVQAVTLRVRCRSSSQNETQVSHIIITMSMFTIDCCFVGGQCSVDSWLQLTLHGNQNMTASCVHSLCCMLAVSLLQWNELQEGATFVQRGAAACGAAGCCCYVRRPL
jgi:hypothetical protein